MDYIIRDFLKEGDISKIALMHSEIYTQEYQYNVGFEAYVLKGLAEFYLDNFELNKCWLVEMNDKILGSLFAIHRGKENQLRFFILDKRLRGMGIGKKLMENYFAFIDLKKYSQTYLWTTNEQKEAIKMYEKYGYRLKEDKESLSFGKPLTELKFTKEL